MNNTGLILEYNKDDYVFLGSNTPFGGNDVMSNSDWSPFKGRNERQRLSNWDTWNCVAFSACNCIEMYFNYLIQHGKLSSEGLGWLIKNGYLVNGLIEVSDRFVGVKAGTRVGLGNSGSVVAKAIKDYGLIPESRLPFTEDMTQSQYYAPTDDELDKLGEEFKERFKIEYESVWSQNFKKALRQAPLQVYVNAWYQNNDQVYYNPNQNINHAVARVKSGKEQVWDTYETFTKSLTNDYYYYPSGYKFIVNEIIMDTSKFLKQNDLRWVRNNETGAFGRVMQGELKTFETDDRATLCLVDNEYRKYGIGVTDEEWERLPKNNF